MRLKYIISNYRTKLLLNLTKYFSEIFYDNNCTEVYFYILSNKYNIMKYVV